MDRLLKGKVAIVTGAGRGIGVEIARELAAAGANLILNYATSAAAAERLAKELSEYGGKHIAVKADVSDFNEAQRLAEVANDTYGQIDILVNNAGITRDKTLKNMTFGQWDEVIKTNLYSVFNCTKGVLPYMLARNYGRIVNVSSVVALAGNIGQANYAATKAGIIGFTKSVALEVSKNGITINVVAPGFVETDMVREMPETIRQRMLEKIPLGRFGAAQEIARCVRYLVSEADYMTAQVISLNGGIYV